MIEQMALPITEIEIKWTPKGWLAAIDGSRVFAKLPPLTAKATFPMVRRHLQDCFGNNCHVRVATRHLKE